MMKTRFGFANAAALAALMISFPAAAQDGASKPEPEAPAKRPKVAPKKAPAPKDAAPDEEAKDEAAEEEAANQAEAEDVEAEADDAEAQDAEGTTEPEADEESAPEDAVSPDDEEAEAGPAGEPEAEPAPPPAKRRQRPRRPAKTTSTTPSKMPNELEYIEGADVPDGYTKVERMRTGLVIAGAVTFGVGWLAAATAAAAASGDDHGCGSHDYGEAFWCEGGYDTEDLAPLYIPVAGPFIAMGTLEHANGGLRAGLLVDGVMQVGGAAMFIAGLAAKKTMLVRTKLGSVSVAPGPGSVHLHGSF